MINFSDHKTKKIIILTTGLVILLLLALAFTSLAFAPDWCFITEDCSDIDSSYPYKVGEDFCGYFAWCFSSCPSDCCCPSVVSYPYCCGGGQIIPINCTCNQSHFMGACAWPVTPVLCEGDLWPAGTGCTTCNGTLCANYQASCSSMSCCPSSICRVDYDGSGNFCCLGNQCGHDNACYADGTLLGNYQCSAGVWEFIILPPSVATEITEADVDVQNDQATLKGNVTNTGAEDPDQRYIDWDNDASGEPYANTVDFGGGGTGVFSTTIDITPGIIYYYRARASNSAGEGEGVERKALIYTAEGSQKSFATLLTDPPIVDAGPDKEVWEGQLVILEGSGSDPEGDPMTFSWSCCEAYYCDNDADGYYSTTPFCVVDSGCQTIKGDDCDDDCDTCYPGSTYYTDAPDGKDQDCDGTVDEEDEYFSCAVALNTDWGSGDVYGCSSTNQRCDEGVCRTCDGYLYSDGCSGCVGQGGSACWRYGIANTSCSAICAGYGGCVAANWNDSSSCDVCKAWIAPVVPVGCEQMNVTYAPNMVGIFILNWHNCYYRSAGVNQICAETTGGAYNYRMCVCQY